MKNDSTVDEIDLKILISLQHNARLSFADLGREISLSPSATRERVQRMEESGVIKKYAIELDYKSLGYELEVFISVKVFHGQLSLFLKIIKDFKEVKEAYRITGEQNVHLKVILKDRIHLQEFIDELMKYGDTNTSLILSKLELNHA
jgi:Lrp/AsnC family transcriptional regulator, leucine-responsive regulatory protein